MEIVLGSLNYHPFILTLTFLRPILWIEVTYEPTNNVDCRVQPRLKWCPVNFWCLWTNSCLCWGKVLKIINLNFPRLHKFCISCIPQGLVCGNISKIHILEQILNSYLLKKTFIFLSIVATLQLLLQYVCRFCLHGSQPWLGVFPSSWGQQRRMVWSCTIQGLGERWVCLAQIAQILRNENIYIPILVSHLLIIAPLVF